VGYSPSLENAYRIRAPKIIETVSSMLGIEAAGPFATSPASAVSAQY
jgi:hypothetical protein